jgi:competence/damage-inducible protein CinA-like protein
MPQVRTAEILAVGTELLTPHRLDTNSLFLTGRLNELGIDVRAKAVVGDDRADLAALLRQALGRADLVITTGGLGPTDDDVTREAVAGILGLPLVEDAGLLEAIRRRFAARGMRMAEINRRQAQVPQGAALVANTRGTAPGLWIDAGERIVLLLPGPPRELEPMFDEGVRPKLAPLTGGRRVRRRVIKLTGRAESQVDEVAHPIYAGFRDGPLPIETTILATPGRIELHLSVRSADVEAADRALDSAVAQLAEALQPFVFSVDGRSLEQVVGDLLGARGWHLAAAESCTGGLVMGRLTDVPGSSAWLLGGVVAYDNDVKVRELGVPAELIARDGAVSESVAVAMAMGVRTRLGADVGVGVTGIAGPTGGTPAKPVGTVVIAMDGPAPRVQTFTFPGDRRAVRAHSVAAALEMVRRALLQA